MQLFCFRQLITNFTRVTDKSATIIDQILRNSNSTSKISQSGVIPVGLSDHFLIYCTRKTLNGQINKQKPIKIRSLKKYNASLYISRLSNVNWNDLVSSHLDVNMVWCRFKETLISILNKVAPVKEVSLKQRTEPWMNSEILNDIRDRDNLLHNFNKNCSRKDLFKEYKKLRNKIQRDIKKAKSEYFLSELETNKTNCKQYTKESTRCNLDCALIFLGVSW